MCLPCTVTDILSVEYCRAWLWNLGYGLFKVTENGIIRKPGYHFLFAFYYKLLWLYHYPVDTIDEHHGQADTARRHRPLLFIASRGKNVCSYTTNTTTTTTTTKIDIHCESKKLDPFSFEHNFSKCCPIIIIISLLQTEINCDQAYLKIYHQTPNLILYYLVKWTRMYWPKLLAWFRN